MVTVLIAKILLKILTICLWTASLFKRFGKLSWIIAPFLNANLYFIDWIKNIWRYEKTYNRIYSNPLENFVISWSIWIHRNNTIFRNWKMQPAQVINLAVNTFYELRSYNIVSSIFEQDVNCDNWRKPKMKKYCHMQSPPSRRRLDKNQCRRI